ncbi:uncharacterized protein LOC116338245 [Contarinia nasturtii]|uniref:uncharacterized protein LOC116338245 n=1 Tax=Contarinia nasturtii TaxID=265458 RepID=UPI0012D3AA5E|nr:uncharacterized protein LOC116338245 [Contarinia nasturtii]
MENLWKKESTPKSPIYMDIFDGIELVPIPNVKFGLQKNDLISTQLRHKGDQKFGENLWSEAMEYYNKSLRFAIKAENASLAYANRAACFLHLKMFDKCLADIEMSKRVNCPLKEVMIKLDKCKADCLKRMRRNYQKETHDQAGLSYDCDVNIPCLADVLKIQYNEKFGRHIVAKCDIPVGKVILVENACFSATLSGPLTGCTTCQRLRMNFIACENCTIAMFCDEMCKESAFHKYDCNVIYDHDTINNGQFQMMARTIFFGLEAFGSVFDEIVEATEELKENYVPQTMIDMQSKYRLFLTLPTPTLKEIEKHELMCKAKSLFTILIKLTTVNGVFDTVEKQRFLMHLVTKHVIITSENAINAKHNNIQRVATLGLIFPLFNHVCVPNLLSYSSSDQQICTTLRPVQAGQRLFVSYTLDEVSTKFGFPCTCEKCDPKHSTSDVTNLLSDPGYAFLQRNRNNNLLNQKNRQNIKRKCIDLLNKHGRLWFPELEFVLDVYIKCELHEEI